MKSTKNLDGGNFLSGVLVEAIITEYEEDWTWLMLLVSKTNFKNWWLKIFVKNEKVKLIWIFILNFGRYFCRYKELILIAYYK